MTRKVGTLSREEQLAVAIDALSEHVVLFDADDRIILANRAWRELNKDVAEFAKPGVTFEEHLRAAMARGLIPEAKGREEAWLRERMERHRQPSGPFEVARQDGRWVRIFEQRLPDDGIILVISDVTESKRVDRALRANEELFRAVVNNSPTKIHIKDAAGRYTLINDLAAKLFSVDAEETLGKTSHEVFPKDKADAFATHDQGVLESGTPVEQEEVWQWEGTARTFLTVKFPIYSCAGEVTGVGAIGTDITDRKETEAKLRRSEELLHMQVKNLEKAQRRLERQGQDLTRLAEDLKAARDQSEAANRAKSEFLATMSHELRTPLNAIIGFSEIMKDEQMGPIGSATYKDYSQDINDSGLHLLELINDILDLSKVESGLDELHEVDIDISGIVPAVMRLVYQRAHVGNVVLEQTVSHDLPDLRADERKLKQILVNLLTNAIKFTNPGGKVTLRCDCDRDGGHVFEIADTGIGIADSDIPKAFSQFGQVDGAFNRKHEGTGLGLPLTKALVELHGGTLGLQSEFGAGTTVTVRFPATRSLPQRQVISG